MSARLVLVIAVAASMLAAGAGLYLKGRQDVAPTPPCPSRGHVL